MNIPIHLIQALVVFAEEKTVAAAANRLKTTQPTITRQLQNIQSLLPYPLFEQQGRKKNLTPYGKVLVDKLAGQFMDFESIFQEALIEQGSSKNIKIAIGGRSEILKRFFGNKLFSGKLALESMGHAQLERALAHGLMDVGVSQKEILTSNYVRKKLFADYFCLVVPHTFLRKHGGKIEKWMDHYLDYPFCTYKSDTHEMKKTLQLAGFSSAPEENFTFSDWEILEERINQGLNWGMVPSSYLKESKNYVFKKIDSSQEQIFYIYYRKSLSRFEWFRKFLEL